MDMKSLKIQIEEKFGIPYEEFCELDPEIITELIEAKIGKKLKPDDRLIIDGIPIDKQHVIQREEYSYAKESLQYFMNKVLNMLKILEIWFGLEGSSEREIIIPRSVEFNSETLGNSDELLHTLSVFKESIEEYSDIRNNGETFIQLAFDIEKAFIENPNYYGLNGKAVVQELCNIYELLQKDEEPMVQCWGERWIYVPIRLFQLRRIVGLSNEDKGTR